MKRQPKKQSARRRPITLRQNLEMADGCLDMIRETLESTGLPMAGCPPMFYNDAIRQLVVILGRKAGLTKWDEVRAVVSEHEKAKGVL